MCDAKDVPGRIRVSGGASADFYGHEYTSSRIFYPMTAAQIYCAMREG